MKKKIFWTILIIFISFVILGIIGQFLPDETNAENHSSRKYINSKYGFSLYKPAGWLIEINPPIIALSKDKTGNTSIIIRPLYGANPKMSAITLSSLVFRKEKKIYPDMCLFQALMNKDGSLVQFTADFTNKNKVPVRQLYLTSLKNGQGLIAGIQSPKKYFDTESITFKKVLGSFRVNPKIFYSMKGKISSNIPTSQVQPLAPTINSRNLVMRSSPDRTVFVKCPPNWQVGGGEMYFAAEDSVNGMGVLMKNEYFPGGTHAQYLISKVLAPFGVYNIRILSDKHNPQIGGDYNARNIEVGFTARNSVQGTGYFAVVLTPPGPMGYSAVTTQGFWSPSNLYKRNFSILYAIAMSIDINEAVVNQKYAQLFARIQQTQRIMAETSDIMWSAIKNQMRNTNRIIDKYSDYMHGEYRVYSEIEDKVYTVDSRVGTYVENPNYPDELMGPVPDDKWEYVPDRSLIEP